MLEPFFERSIFEGKTFGLSPSGYDIRIAENLELNPGGFILGSSIEHFKIPTDILGIVHDKSTWARLGIAVQNTVLEPGWEGYLTIEISNHGTSNFFIKGGTPIAQVIFHKLDRPTQTPYSGKYQNQKQGVQEAILE